MTWNQWACFSYRAKSSVGRSSEIDSDLIRLVRERDAPSRKILFLFHLASSVLGLLSTALMALARASVEDHASIVSESVRSGAK